MKTDKGVALWNRAKKIIPGGTQLLSKRSEMFLPDHWPSYFSKAKGVDVWDLDGNRLIDMSIMGVGANILGYADSDVNKAVKKVIDDSSMCTLNSPEEVELAEILLGIDKWAGMVRYARTAGEALTVAVRIGRAHTRKDKIAFCGYHGWHDWYLAANLADDKSLDGHLLPGLEPNGVPRVLKGTSLPFNYNKVEELEAIVEKNKDIGVIVVEPVRHHEPEKGFLNKVRAIADRIGAVLIFDEVTSGWRINIGGAYTKYNVKPDIVVYGKAMSNGFPMAAIVGKTEVMNAAQTSFISSTYWTERIGPTATIATIKKMRENNVPAHLIEIGNMISAGWGKLSDKHGLALHVAGIPPLTSYSFENKNAQAMNTLFTQEMLERGFMAKTSVYVSYSHTKEHVAKYLEAADDVFELIKKASDENKVEKMLKGPIAHTGFKRLT